MCEAGIAQQMLFVVNAFRADRHRKSDQRSEQTHACARRPPRATLPHISYRHFSVRSFTGSEDSAGRDQPAIGKIVAAAIVATRPTMPISVVIGVTYLRPSASVIPLIRVITQKPLSFIQAIGLEPQPMAMAR